MNKCAQALHRRWSAYCQQRRPLPPWMCWLRLLRQLCANRYHAPAIIEDGSITLVDSRHPVVEVC